VYVCVGKIWRDEGDRHVESESSKQGVADDKHKSEKILSEENVKWEQWKRKGGNKGITKGAVGQEVWTEREMQRKRREETIRETERGT